MPALTIIRSYVPEDMRERVHPDASLADLRINQLDRFYSMPVALEEEFGLSFTDAVIASWVTVSDVLTTIRGLVAA